MTAASKKRMTQKEVKAPDEFLTSMGRGIEFLQLYGGWILAGAAAVLVAIVAGTLLSRRHDAALVEEAMAFRGAFSPVVTAAKARESGDEKAVEEALNKLSGAAGDLEKFATEHEDSALAGLAWVARGAALLLAGQAGPALESFERGLATQGDAAWRPILLEAVGVAADEAGRRDEAERYYTEMTRAGSRLFRAMGYLHLGDLAHPLAGEPGDAARAREMYAKGLAEVPADDALLAPAERLTRGLIEQRLATLP